MLYEQAENNSVKCYLCEHHCKIQEGKYGICRVRQNKDGKLYTSAYGKSIAANVDPIEKKPLYHFLPGSKAFSIATMGCNFKCSFCQNWRISQVTDDKQTNLPGQKLSPKDIVRLARNKGSDSIAYTYTEPTIFFEYAYDIAELARKNDMKNIFVTNGYMTKSAIDTVTPYLDAANVDLKSFRNDFYIKMCKGRLQPVLDSIQYMKESGIWVEVTTLVVPDQNDSDEELNDIAEFIASVSKDIPWHVSRFHPDYEYTNATSTPIRTMEKAHKIGKKHGLKYIYLGNIATDNNTYCDNCNEIVIERNAFGVNKVKLENSKCPSCKAKISGIWKK